MIESPIMSIRRVLKGGGTKVPPFPASNPNRFINAVGETPAEPGSSVYSTVMLFTSAESATAIRYVGTVDTTRRLLASKLLMYTDRRPVKPGLSVELEKRVRSHPRRRH